MILHCASPGAQPSLESEEPPQNEPLQGGQAPGHPVTLPASSACSGPRIHHHPCNIVGMPQACVLMQVAHPQWFLHRAFGRMQCH